MDFIFGVCFAYYIICCCCGSISIYENDCNIFRASITESQTFMRFVDIEQLDV